MENIPPKITLRAARANAMMTALEAAELAGVHQQTITKYEHDSTDIPRSLSKKLSHIYNYPLDYIFLGKTYRLKGRHKTS